MQGQGEKLSPSPRLSRYAKILEYAFFNIKMMKYNFNYHSKLLQALEISMKILKIGLCGKWWKSYEVNL